jgi:hypothetical protein
LKIFLQLASHPPITYIGGKGKFAYVLHWSETTRRKEIHPIYLVISVKREMWKPIEFRQVSCNHLKNVRHVQTQQNKAEPYQTDAWNW